jgi:6-phosphofructokinase 1
MEKKIKTIGVLTSGGDAPGNERRRPLRGRTALHNELNVVGIFKGYSGLMTNQMKELTLRSVSDTLQRGGTFLYLRPVPGIQGDAGV